MESNGKKESIHASQEVADILYASGKGHWVHPRGEKIVSRQKGIVLVEGLLLLTLIFLFFAVCQGQRRTPNILDSSDYRRVRHVRGVDAYGYRDG
jgi:hypothetical protein